MTKLKNSNATFWVIFKQCAVAFQSFSLSRFELQSFTLNTPSYTLFQSPYSLGEQQQLWRCALLSCKIQSPVVFGELSRKHRIHDVWYKRSWHHPTQSVLGWQKFGLRFGADRQVGSQPYFKCGHCTFTTSGQFQFSQFGFNASLCGWHAPWRPFDTLWSLCQVYQRRCQQKWSFSTLLQWGK